MGSGVAKGANPDILIINHSTAFDVTVDSSLKSSQSSLSSVEREKRKNKMMFSMPEGDAVAMPDVEDVSKKTKDVAAPTAAPASQAEKKIVQKLTEEQVLTKAQEIITRLLSTVDYRTTDCATDMTFLRKYSAHSSDNDRRVRYFDKLTDMGVTSLFERVWSNHFADSFTDEGENELWNNMKCILIVMWNGTDRSKKLCQSVVDQKTYLPILKWLKDPKLEPEKTNGVRQSYTVKGFFGVIHNTLSQCDTRHAFREAGIVQTLKPFLHSPNLMVSILSFLSFLKLKVVPKYF